MNWFKENFLKAIVLLSLVCLALAFSGCSQKQGGGAQASAVPSVVPSIAATQSPAAASSSVEAEPSLSAAQQQGGAETESGDFVFDLPDASGAQGSDFDAGMDSFG